MQRAAMELIPVAQRPPTALAPTVRFLTGSRFAHQTAFCAHGLAESSAVGVHFEFFDDGTLRPADKENLARIFPNSRVVAVQECVERLDRALPTDRFPNLRAMRAYSILMRKLLDLQAGLTGPSLYLDSDMLFFGTPRHLLGWLARPDGALYMRQEADAYVDAREPLDRQLGSNLLPGVNSGIIAVNASEIDWVDLERAASTFAEAQRRHFWGEQTLMAYLMTRLGASALAPTDYQVCFNRNDVRLSKACLRHYVFKAKMPYVQTEWRKYLKGLLGAPSG